MYLLYLLHELHKNCILAQRKKGILNGVQVTQNTFLRHQSSPSMLDALWWEFFVVYDYGVCVCGNHNQHGYITLFKFK